MRVLPQGKISHFFGYPRRDVPRALWDVPRTLQDVPYREEASDGDGDCNDYYNCEAHDKGPCE